MRKHILIATMTCSAFQQMRGSAEEEGGGGGVVVGGEGGEGGVVGGSLTNSVFLICYRPPHTLLHMTHSYSKCTQVNNTRNFTVIL